MLSQKLVDIRTIMPSELMVCTYITLFPVAAPLRAAQLVVTCSSTCREPYRILSLSCALANRNTVVSRTKLLMLLFFVLKAESLCCMLCILWYIQSGKQVFVLFVSDLVLFFTGEVGALRRDLGQKPDRERILIKEGEE